MEHARRATPADSDTLAELLLAEHAEALTQRGGDMWIACASPPTAERLEALFDDPAALVLAGCIDEVVLGIATARIVDADGVGRVAFIDDLYVDRAAREVGIGDALIEQVMQWARRHACVGVDATALPGDRATKNFFEAHGLVARSITVHHRFNANGNGNGNPLT